ncbi:hypothetical protein H5410_030715 [Solanum commersonii]|uniref:Uncharacterized protein n=1 Tax=Solanum commersonii TaxID=4109 RepID=A0A9J5YGI3_SOLCO|nr:hypothetical protein H5410_030715 [Solanum commersonii]
MHSTILNLLMEGSIVHSKILKFTILVSNESSSSNQVLKCPYTKMITYSHTILQQFKVCPYFPLNIRFISLKIKKVFSRLEMELNVKEKDRAQRGFKQSSHTHKDHFNSLHHLVNWTNGANSRCYHILFTVSSSHKALTPISNKTPHFR